MPAPLRARSSGMLPQPPRAIAQALMKASLRVDRLLLIMAFLLEC
jgi:hypothetical protein